MKRNAVLAALLLSLLFVAEGAAAEEGDRPTSTQPPKNLTKVGDHWTPWNPPAAGPNDYIIQPHDTLWDLSQKWLQDPRLWPQIWDQNRYILDSHWIYPGDPLVVPGKPTVVQPGAPPPMTITEAPSEDTGGTPTPASGATVKALPPLMAVADPSDLYCSGYIDSDHAQSSVWIVGREIERDRVGQGDVVFLNQGRSQGRHAGEELAVIRSVHPVMHPATGKSLGSLVRRLGRVRILAAQENTSTAVIEMACQDMGETDEIVPWTDIPAPMLRELPKFNRYDANPSGGSQGYVVDLPEEIPAAGTGHIVQTDLGAGSGVRPGDVLKVYRDNDDLPRLLIGQAVVLTVEPGSSTVKVMLAVRELEVGDRVEKLR